MTTPPPTDTDDATFTGGHDTGECARCGAPIRYDPADPSNDAMRVCNDCAIDLGEEIDQ